MTVEDATGGDDATIPATPAVKPLGDLPTVDLLGAALGQETTAPDCVGPPCHGGARSVAAGHIQVQVHQGKGAVT